MSETEQQSIRSMHWGDSEEAKTYLLSFELPPTDSEVSLIYNPRNEDLSYCMGTMYDVRTEIELFWEERLNGSLLKKLFNNFIFKKSIKVSSGIRPISKDDYSEQILSHINLMQEHSSRIIYADTDVDFLSELESIPHVSTINANQENFYDALYDTCSNLQTS